MKQYPKQYSTFFGFTLIELMITLAVGAILLSVAVPSFSTLTRNNRLITQNNLIVSALMVARSEAVKRGTTVTVCGSSDSATCNTSSWENGWIVFSDYDADQVTDLGGGACAESEDCILRVSNGLSGDNTLRSSTFANADFIQYDSQGVIDSSGSFTVCDNRGTSEALAVNINAMGRTSSATDTDSDNIVNTIDGSDATCP